MNRFGFWILKIAVSIGDQGLVSGANFLLNIFLARSISPSQYGAFSIGFSVFLFFSGFQNALILEPMSVLQPKNPQWETGNYLKTLIVANFFLTGALGFVLIFIALLFPDLLGEDRLTFIGVALSTPFILLFWLMRRTCYLYSWTSLAFQGSIVYGLTLIVGLYFLSLIKNISSFSAFILLGTSGFGASLYYWLLMNRSFKAGHVKFRFLKEIILPHWNYGRWVTGSAFVSWLGSNVLVPLIGISIGLSHAGIFRAIQNTILPLQQVLVAVVLLFLPRLSGMLLIAQRKSVKKISYVMVSGITITAFLYVCFLSAFPRQIIEILYVRKEYQDFYWLVYYLGGFAILDAMGIGTALVLRAAEKPYAIFWSQTGAAITLIPITILLIRNYGIQGAAIALVISGVIALIILIWFYRIVYNENTA